MTDTTLIEDGATGNADTAVVDSSTSNVTEVTSTTNPLRDAIVNALDPKPAEPTAGAPAKPTEPTAAVPAVATAPALDADGRVVEPMKAPNSWSPALRETWGSVDPRAQKFILDRERHMAVELQSTAEARRFKKDFDTVTGPMSELIKQNNWNASINDVTKQLFEMGYALNTGSPQQKAQIIYNLINHFKPDSQTLQALFSGQPANIQPLAPAPKPTSMDDAVKAELDRREAAQQEQDADAAIAAFEANAAHEWFNDVKGQMGQLINAGLIDTTKPFQEQLKDAYDLAVSRHPEIQAIVASRTPAAPAQAPVAAPAPAPAVVARPIQSVKPSLGAGKPSQVPQRAMTAREAAELAFEQATAAR